MKLGLALARGTIGALFVGHGAQKLFGWFGGYGPEGTGQFFESLGLKPGKRNAIMAGVSEATGGALLALGLFTPLASAMLIGTMATAIQKVHGSRGVWVTEGGWEYNAVLIAAVIAITDAGPGDLSLDALLGRERWGPGWALAAAAAGAAGSQLVITAGQRADGQPAGQDATGETPAVTSTEPAADRPAS
ncbi:MAG: DoxX family protein [Conexibacter sp.]|nr:DoxX family protein [Conexibacter sp.]